MADTIRVGKKEYTVLFPDLFRQLDVRQLTQLRKSIRQRGVRVPIVVDESDGIIDGINRARIASEIGLSSIPVVVCNSLTGDGKKQLAISLNADRRHLTQQEQAEFRAQRIKRVAERRRNGESTRTIAEAEGVSQAQVRHDLKDATEQGCSVEPENGRVMGADGKERPATRQPRDADEPGTGTVPGGGEPARISAPSDVDSSSVTDRVCHDPKGFKALWSAWRRATQEAKELFLQKINAVLEKPS